MQVPILKNQLKAKADARLSRSWQVTGFGLSLLPPEKRRDYTKTEIAWRNDGEWKARYSKLYSSRHSSRPIEDPTSRVSFMSKESKPYRSLLQRVVSQKENSICGGSAIMMSDNSDLNTLLSQQSDYWRTNTGTWNSDTDQVDTSNDTNTLLLDMVRAKIRDDEEAQDQTLELPRDDVSEGQSSEACMHGLSMRMTDRSISRRSMSRMSRVSTRRDMDIPSILAFTATVTPGPVPLENPAFQKVKTKLQSDIPRWSIRRSVCPVCSQKWKDKSFINNIKSSGLKRNSSADFPTVIAPAKLRTSITTEYTPRPILAVVDENKPNSGMRNSGASWQLTRARRFRAPKIQMPPEATAPPSATAPLARKDLDIRVNRFLNDEGMEKYLLRPSFNYLIR